jgi:hypothetical protein
LGFKLITVSYISVGAGSVAVEARPALPNTELGEGLDDTVLHLQQIRGLGDRNAWQGGRHVEQRAFVEVRHELGAEPAGRPKGDGEHRKGERDGEGLGVQDRPDHRAVQPDQHPVQRIFLFGDDPATHEEHHQRRHERHRKQRRRGHGKGLGVGQRTKQPSLLCFQRENRQERDGDDQQAGKQRRPDFDRSLDQDLNARPSRLRVFEMLVGVLDHHDGSIDHRADRDRDSAEAHDVGAEAERLHRCERHQDADRKHQDRDQRTAHMQ